MVVAAPTQSSLAPATTGEELPSLLATFNLTQGEFDQITTGLGRWPNKNELAMFSVLWSEHCCYKHSKHLLKTLPTEGERILQGPGENAGVVGIGNGIGVAFKIESHNHPTAVEPFQGAATGVGGILRDIFTMNARPVASLNALRFGPPSAVGFGPQSEKRITPDVTSRNRYLLNGAVKGIAHYGNCVGVPTVGGEVFFDPCFSGNPLVNAMAVGLVYGDTLMPSGAQGIGNPVVYVGSDTGKDGMGGAAFASKELDADASADDRPAVQVGDPFLEKLLIESCLEAFATGHVVAAQDMGAAGLTCSGAEMSAKGSVGMRINLDKVPAREPGMLPHEFLQSESQERMLFVIEAGKEAEVMAIFHRWGLNACVVGEVISEERLIFTMAGETVADVPPSLLTDDAPLYEQLLTPPEPTALQQRRTQQWDSQAYPDLAINKINDWLKKLLANPNIARPTPVFRQYDRHVRNNTTTASEANTAGVIRLRDEDGKPTGQGLAMTVDGLSPYVWLNPKQGAKATVAEAARNLACVGATPLAVTNNLNFGDPEKPETYYHLAESVAGMGEACQAFNTPVTGGNVSLYNERGGSDGTAQAILPSPVIGMVGLLNDVTKTVTSHVTQAGNVLVLVGKFSPSLGGSQYQMARCGHYFGEPPTVDLAIEKALQTALPQWIQNNWVTAAHDVSLGGLLVNGVEMLVPPALQSQSSEKHLGLSLDLSALCETEARFDQCLFGETAGSVLVAVSEQQLANLQQSAGERGLSATVLGRVTNESKLSITVNKQTTVLDVPPLIETFTTSFQTQLEGGV